MKNEVVSEADVLLLPGWQNSGPEHWQSHWEALHGFVRVQQHDWMRPLRGDWLIQLEEAVLAATRPVVLVAHSLGCIQAAAWAAHSRHAHRVRAALLVAPGDTEQPDLAPQLPTWQPVALQRLPFASLLVASRNDPYCRFERAQAFASAWGSTLHDLGPAGHINAETRLGDWPQGLTLLRALLAPAVPSSTC
jgi:predicted alpha/beta hydrolase family esterase